MQSEKKTAGYEHTLPISYADHRSGLQSDMLHQIYYFYFPFIVKENDGAPEEENASVGTITGFGGSPLKAPIPA